MVPEGKWRMKRMTVDARGSSCHVDDTTKTNDTSVTTHPATTTTTLTSIPMDDSPQFYHDKKHVFYVETLMNMVLERDTFEGALTNHLRLSGVYWSVSTMCLLCGDDLEIVNEKMGVVRDLSNK